LDLAEGSRHFIVGPNGAGKTTLLGVIAGTIRPIAGRIILNGADITFMPPHRIARLRVARTWQHPAICGNLTAEENVVLACRRDATSAQRRRRAQALLDDSGLAEYAAEPAGHLSYGQQRRLELAVALAAQPRLLLLDEPSAGLSEKDADVLIEHLTSPGLPTTMLITEHNPKVVEALADEVTALHRGQAVDDSAALPDFIRRQSTRTSHGKSSLDGLEHRPAPVLTVRNLTADHAHRRILSGVDLDLYPGQVLAVTGHNGAGKSTLLRAIAGLTPTGPTTRIMLDGHAVTGHSAAQRAARGICLVPQERRVFAGLTVAENLRIATKPARGRLWTISGVLAALPDLSARLNQRAATLSGGEQQQLAFARALLNQPRVLLLDEPMEGLTSPAVEQLRGLIVGVSESGSAVIVVEHNAHVLKTVADTISDLEDGVLHLSTRLNRLELETT
jgi:ABC-type branched-subunit amino acid transport system ATPase component